MKAPLPIGERGWGEGAFAVVFVFVFAVALALLIFGFPSVAARAVGKTRKGDAHGCASFSTVQDVL